jgi:hypothetical protein
VSPVFGGKCFTSGKISAYTRSEKQLKGMNQVAARLARSHTVRSSSVQRISVYFPKLKLGTCHMELNGAKVVLRREDHELRNSAIEEPACLLKLVVVDKWKQEVTRCQSKACRPRQPPWSVGQGVRDFALLEISHLHLLYIHDRRFPPAFNPVSTP